MQRIGLGSDLHSRMSEATQPKSVGLPRLPSWDLTGTASQLYEQQASTKVILGTYQTFLSDLIGNDTVLHIMNVLHEGFGTEKYAPAPLLVQMVEEGKLGRKSGQGFYTY